MSKQIEEANAVEAEMELTWDPARENMAKQYLGGYRVKRSYFEQPVAYQDSIKIDALEAPVEALNDLGRKIRGRFIVTYSVTGAQFLFWSWEDAVAFRNGRAGHLQAGYRAFR